jgi:hypothetical protein
MPWQVRQAYARATPAAVEMVERVGEPYILLRPPAVSVPLLLIDRPGRWPAYRDAFAAWRRTAEVLEAKVVAERTGVGIVPYFHLPRRQELLSLKWFANAATASVVLYGAETFGGAAEYEWCWVFEPGTADRAFVLAERYVAVERTVSGWFGRKTTTTARVRRDIMYEVTPSATVEHPGEVLKVCAEATRYLGIWAPGGRFAPHARGEVKWADYRVVPAPGWGVAG